jgi:hypothetical protein
LKLNDGSSSSPSRICAISAKRRLLVVAFLQQIEFVCAVIPDELRTGLVAARLKASGEGSEKGARPPLGEKLT